MAQKLTTEQFIEKAKKIRGDKYDYSKVEYINSKTKVCIICPEHGEFLQTPSNHLLYECPQCAGNQKLTTEQFIVEVKKIHKNKYDYSKVEYINSKTKVCIICPEHGEFEQIAADHKRGNGCPICGGSRKSTTEQFIKKANKIHKNKYDYSKVEYQNAFDKVIIICSEHGEFEQRPNDHLNGYGCKQCFIDSTKIETEDFVRRSNKIHNNKYDYSKVDYKNGHTKVIIICPEHGEFLQKPAMHLLGKGCKECLKLGAKQFAEKSKEIHNDKYDYSNVDYENKSTKVCITCPKHGEFWRQPGNHLSSHGCPKCALEIQVSSGHQEILDYVKLYYDGKIEINDRQVIAPLELDIYLPELNLAFEYHGAYYHSYNKQESTEEKKRHYTKHDLCLKRGIKLIQIYETEWKDSKTRVVLESKIKNYLGLGKRIFARKCKIKEPSNPEYKEFMDKYHMQGYRGATVKLGLFYEDELVACLSFNKHHKYEWEITRFVNKAEINVIGGASRLLKYFIRSHNPKQIMTYADRRYSDGNLYRKIGFKLDGITSPNYQYIKSGMIYSRQHFQKHKLAKRLEIFDPTLTESENMFMNGYRRIWDAGNYRFLWR